MSAPQTPTSGSNTTSAPPLRVAVVGWGAIAPVTGRLLRDHNAAVEIVAVAVRDPNKARLDLPDRAALVTTPAEMLATGPDLVVEIAGRDSVVPWGRAALAAGVDLMVSSVSAFAEPGLLDEFLTLAVETGARVHIPPGALGGVDALVAGKFMGVESVEHRIVKPPKAWRGTLAESLCDLETITEPTAFFVGNSIEAASQFPKNANVAMTTALSGVGPEQTVIRLIAEPGATRNRHEITASGGFGQLEVTLANEALPTNPKSSAMTALSLARAIGNLRNPLVI